MKKRRRPRKTTKDLAAREGARRVKGGAGRTTVGPGLTPPSPPSGPIPIPYPN